MYYKNWWWSSMMSRVNSTVHVLVEHQTLGTVHTGKIQMNELITNRSDRNLVVTIDGNIYMFSGTEVIECVHKFIDWLEQ